MKILVVEPGKSALCKRNLTGSEGNAAGGGRPNQAVYPFQDSAAPCVSRGRKAAEAAPESSPANGRWDGPRYDSPAFSLCADWPGQLQLSLTEQIQRYMSYFQRPEQFLNISRKVCLIPPE